MFLYIQHHQLEINLFWRSWYLYFVEVLSSWNPSSQICFVWAEEKGLAWETRDCQNQGRTAPKNNLTFWDLRAIHPWCPHESMIYSHAMPLFFLSYHFMPLPCLEFLVFIASQRIKIIYRFGSSKWDGDSGTYSSVYLFSFFFYLQAGEWRSNFCRQRDN